jgi:hypothetical protein
MNLEYIKEALLEAKEYPELFETLNPEALYTFDKIAGRWFNALLKAFNLKGKWWFAC